MSDSKNEKKITVKKDDCLTTIKSIISERWNWEEK